MIENMKKLSELIPTTDTLKSRGAHLLSVKPTQQALEQMDKTLSEFGYTEYNKDVYHSIRCFGALLIDGTARKGLFLKGECGIGKSFGVEILANVFKMPVFKPDDFASVTKEFDGNMADVEDYVIQGGDFFERPQNIVIDELGSRDTTKTYGEQFDLMSDILDMRYRAFHKYGVLTIVTTNLSDADIRNRYGRRIEDRMQEMFYIKRVSGVSLRQAV